MSKQVSPPSPASKGTAKEDLEECLYLQLWDINSQYSSLPPKSKCCVATKETPRKPLIHDQVFAKPYGRAERSGSAVRHTEHTSNLLTENTTHSQQEQWETSDTGLRTSPTAHCNFTSGKSDQEMIFWTTKVTGRWPLSRTLVWKAADPRCVSSSPPPCPVSRSCQCSHQPSAPALRGGEHCSHQHRA